MKFLALFGYSIGFLSVCFAEPAPVYKQPSVAIDMRVEDLLSRMTLEEKLAQLVGPSYGLTKSVSENYLRKNYSQGVGSVGNLHLSLEDDVRVRNTVQKFLREETRLGIPALFHDEGCHGLMKPEATSFPNPLGLACSWDPDLIERCFDVVGREMRARGAQHALAPVVDVARDPRWGRIDETMGEDPFLNGRLGGAMVQGLQGSKDGTVDEYHVLATLKHFAGHGVPEGGLNQSPAVGGLRDLREVHLPPFEYIIANVHPAAVMPSYNEVDGVPSHGNRWLLQEVLRGEMGFKELIVSDYDGIKNLVNDQHVVADKTAAGVLALSVGVQLELPTPYGFPALAGGVQQGLVKMEQIDAAVRAVLAWKFRLGLFENPYADATVARAAVEDPKNRQLALEAAEKSIVLLKNDGALLPLQIEKYKKIAVIGPNANIARLGSYSGTPKETISILYGIRTRVAGQAEVVYAQGCVLVKNEPTEAFLRWNRADNVTLATDEENKPVIEEAVRVANTADLVVLVIGETESLCRETWTAVHPGDATTLELRGSQTALVDAILGTGKPVIVYLMNGRPLAIGGLAKRVPALLEGWYMGQETGTAVARILFGDVVPSGKLTVSLPKSVGHLPSYYAKKRHSGAFPYQFSDNTPVFPFGFGLSYTTFKYSELTVSPSKITRDGTATVSVAVSNTGTRSGDEIVQLYIRDEVSSVTRPVKELKGFQRVRLAPGETKTVTFPITREALWFYNIDMQRVVEPGWFTVMVGGSSVDTINERLEVE